MNGESRESLPRKTGILKAAIWGLVSGVLVAVLVWAIVRDSIPVGLLVARIQSSISMDVRWLTAGLLIIAAAIFYARFHLTSSRLRWICIGGILLPAFAYNVSEFDEINLSEAYRLHQNPEGELLVDQIRRLPDAYTGIEYLQWFRRNLSGSELVLKRSVADALGVRAHRLAGLANVTTTYLPEASTSPNTNTLAKWTDGHGAWEVVLVPLNIELRIASAERVRGAKTCAWQVNEGLVLLAEYVDSPCEEAR